MASNIVKAGRVAWLSGRNILYDPNQTGAELLGLVQLSRQIIVQFELDASAYAGGNTIVKPLYPISASITP
jgi:hypothetical protein